MPATIQSTPNQRAAPCSTSSATNATSESATHSTAGIGSSPPRTRTLSGILYGRSRSGSLQRSRHDREPDDRERDRRAERADRGQELEVGGDQQADRGHRAEGDDPHRRRPRAVQRAERGRDLAVDRQRVAEPRQAEHRRLRGADEDHDGRDRDQVLQRLADPGLVERVGDAQQRRLDPARAGRRQHRGGDERDPEVRHERREQAHADQPPQPGAADRHLPGQARGGVDPAEGHEHEREREDEVLESTATPRPTPDAAARRARTAARARARRRAPAARGRRGRAPPRARSGAGPPPRIASSATNSTIAAPIRNSLRPVVEPAPEERRGSRSTRTRTARRGSGSPGRSPSRR